MITPNKFQSFKQFKNQAKEFSKKFGYSVVYSDGKDIFNIAPVSFKEKNEIFHFFKRKFQL